MAMYLVFHESEWPSCHPPPTAPLFCPMGNV